MSETASEIAVLRAALAAAEARASAAEGALVAAKGELTQVQAIVSASEDMIRHLRLQIAKLRREQYGHGAERHARLIEPKMPAQGKNQQKAQTAVGRHNAAQFKGIEPQKFNDYAKGKSQRPVAGKEARKQGQTDGAVYEADDEG